MKVTRILLILLCFAFSFTAIHAQDKYEYGQVTYANVTMTSLTKYRITVSTTTFQSMDEGKLDDGTMTNNFVPVNKVINDLSEKGCEVYNTGTVVNVGNAANYYYYIRKKK